MANNVMNVVRVEGEAEQIRKLLYKVQDDRYGPGSIDFNKITPMPKDVAETNASLDWARKHWGTKWNANNDSAVLDESIGLLVFGTPWTGVPGLVMKLAFMFPELDVKYLFADEDLGINIGHYQFTGNGVLDLLAKQRIYEGSEMAFMFACEVWGFSEDYIHELLREQ